MKSTNYYNTFIEVAEDCPVEAAETPPQRKNKTAAAIQYELVSAHPYKYTSDDVLFEVFATKNEIPDAERPAARQAFFSKGQPCLRASALTKRYGWGVHSDAEGKIALYPVESEEYVRLAEDPELEHLKAMRSRR